MSDTNNLNADLKARVEAGFDRLCKGKRVEVALRELAEAAQGLLESLDDYGKPNSHSVAMLLDARRMADAVLRREKAKRARKSPPKKNAKSAEITDSRREQIRAEALREHYTERNR